MNWRRALVVFVGIALGIPASDQYSGSSLADIKIAADAGDPAAQDKLAEQFILRADSKQAELWYRKAAEQGFTHAEGRLGQMLLLRSRTMINVSPAERTAVGEDALKWATRAANAGDKRGQADLADICLEGKLVKQDLVEAYRWGDLAAQGSALDTATITGRSTRDAAILKMSADQIAEGKKRVTAFTPHQLAKDELPQPAAVQKLKLSGLSGSADHRLAIINGATFAQGETAKVKLAGESITLRCMEIREKSVVVQIEGAEKPIELFMSDSSH
jgi:hypothetical protein